MISLLGIGVAIITTYVKREDIKGFLNNKMPSSSSFESSVERSSAARRRQSENSNQLTIGDKSNSFDTNERTEILQSKNQNSYRADESEKVNLAQLDTHCLLEKKQLKKGIRPMD